MKNVLILILLCSATLGFSQKKGKVSEEQMAIDSLTKVTSMLTTQLDSTSKSAEGLSMQLDSVTDVLADYQSMHSVIEEKVVKHAFDPSEMGQIIDSLRTHRDSTFSGLTATSVALTDSITTLQKENTSLKAKVASLEAADANKEKIVGELKQLKELLDTNIITQEEYDIRKNKLMAKWQ